MSDTTIESYLVSLGFSIDQTSLQKFNTALADAGKKMSTTVGGLTGDFFKLQFALTSGMAAVAAASFNAMTSFADFDKSLRLAASAALMGKGAYTELTESLKMAGVTLAQASWDPESHQRVLDNMQLIHKLNLALGPDAEANARKIRDFQNQFHQLGEELKYLQFAVGSDLFAKLFGGGDAQKALQRFNEWLLNNLPKLADEISDDLVPIMKDLWETTKDVGLVFKDAFAIFQEVTGILSGDTSIQKTDVDFKSVATTVEHVVHWVDGLVKSILILEQAILHLDFSKLTGGDLAHLGEIALMTGTGRSLLGKGVGAVLGAGGTEAAAGGAGVALAPLAAVGAGLAGTYELYAHRDAVEAWNTRFLQSIGRLPLDSGISPDLIAALVHQESGGHQFDKNGNVLRSPAGALGIGQLMPATARGLGVDPNNQQDNLRGVGMLLSQLSKHYHGNEAEMLAAYNWGEGNFDNALKRHQGNFSMDWLPAETRHYITNIEAAQGRSVANNGDITVIVNAKTNANPHEIGSMVKDALADQQAKAGRFSNAAGTGVSQ